MLIFCTSKIGLSKASQCDGNTRPIILIVFLHLDGDTYDGSCSTEFLLELYTSCNSCNSVPGLRESTGEWRYSNLDLSTTLDKKAII